MWRDVELRELRIFLVLGEELHFGRTAERLGISQPGVSEAVRVLESRLGVKVFDRTSRRVRLTPAGEGLKRRLVPALAALDQALIETSELSHAVRGLLRIGFVLTTEGPALSRLIAAFQASYPACEVRPQEVDTFDAYRALHRDDVRPPVQLACRRPARSDRRRRVRLLSAGTRRRSLSPPRRPQHGVGRRSGRRGGRLAPPVHPVGGLRPDRPPAHAVRTAHPPHSGCPDHQRDPLLVACGRIVHPTSSAVPIFNRDDIVLIPINDLPPMPLGLVWRTSRENPRIRALNEIARSMTAAPGTGPL